MPARTSPELDTATRPLSAAMRGFDTRDAIEDYLDRLNRSSPLAQRGITHWGNPEQPRLRLGAVPLAGRPGDATDTMFMAEARNSFGLEVRAQRAAAAGAPYSVGLVLCGSMRVTLAGGEHVARAGEGIIIDPTQVERTQVAVNSHFVEFMLPRQHLLRLGAELAPGACAGTPQFAPLLPAPVAGQLLAMARQTAQVLVANRPARGKAVLFERWMELIALTLLHEHQPAGAAPVLATTGVAPPRSLRRALDYIDAHAQADILLADIAAAACVSASTLLRQFNTHLGCSPASFLRRVRLDRARAELRQGHAGTVRELAQRWGFQSAGKFSLAYLRRFGERPGAAGAAR